MNMKESTKDSIFTAVAIAISILTLIGFVWIIQGMNDMWSVQTPTVTCHPKTVFVEALPRKEKCEKAGGVYWLDGYKEGWQESCETPSKQINLEE